MPGAFITVTRPGQFTPVLKGVKKNSTFFYYTHTRLYTTTNMSLKRARTVQRMPDVHGHRHGNTDNDNNNNNNNNTMATNEDVIDLLASYAARLLHVETTLQRVLRENTQLKEALDNHVAQYHAPTDKRPAKDTNDDHDHDSDDDDDDFIVLGGTKRKRNVDNDNGSIGDLLEQIGNDSESDSSSVYPIKGQKRKASNASDELFWALSEFPLKNEEIEQWWADYGSVCTSLSNTSRVLDSPDTPTTIKSEFLKFLEYAAMFRTHPLTISATDFSYQFVCEICHYKYMTTVHATIYEYRNHGQICDKCASCLRPLYNIANNIRKLRDIIDVEDWKHAWYKQAWYKRARVIEMADSRIMYDAYRFEDG